MGEVKTECARRESAINIEGVDMCFFRSGLEIIAAMLQAQGVQVMPVDRARDLRYAGDDREAVCRAIDNDLCIKAIINGKTVLAYIDESSKKLCMFATHCSTADHELEKPTEALRSMIEKLLPGAIALAVRVEVAKRQGKKVTVTSDPEVGITLEIEA